MTPSLTDVLHASRTILWTALEFEQRHQNHVLTSRKKLYQALSAYSWPVLVVNAWKFVPALAKMELLYWVVVSSRQQHFESLAFQAKHLLEKAIKVKNEGDPESSKYAQECAFFAIDTLARLTGKPVVDKSVLDLDFWGTCETLVKSSAQKFKLLAHRRTYVLL